MKSSRFVIVLLIVLSLVVAACGSTAAAQSVNPSNATAISCDGTFTATVYRGPNSGATVQGTLILHEDATGSVTGTFKQTKGLHVLSVVGQTNGRAINLLFDLGKQQFLYGVGTMQHDLYTCQGHAGGPLVGPQDPDSGSWGIIWGD